MRSKYKKKTIDNIIVINAISEGAIVNKGSADGKFIPIVIVDSSKNEEIKKAIQLQCESSIGRVNTTWGLDNRITIVKKIYLFIELTEPVQKKFAICFDLEQYKATIDLIINSQLLYIQLGVIGEKPSQIISNDKLLIEVPVSEFKEEWLKILKENFSCKKNKLKFEDFYSKWSDFRNSRFK